jgi:hypothetical protein
MKIIYNIIGFILGFKVEKLKDGVIIRFPIWTSKKMRRDVIDNLKKDYEVRYNKSMKVTLGYRLAKLEYE